MSSKPWLQSTTHEGQVISYLLHETAADPALLKYVLSAAVKWPYQAPRVFPQRVDIPADTVEKLSASQDFMRIVRRMGYREFLSWTWPEDRILNLAADRFNLLGQFVMGDARAPVTEVGADDVRAIAKLLCNGGTHMFE